jgi:hypothetical protein
MYSSLLFALILTSQGAAEDVVISDPRDSRIERSPGFAVTPCPYALSGSYLEGPARSGVPGTPYLTIDGERGFC